MVSVFVNIAFLIIQVPASLFIIVINAMVIHVVLGVYGLQPSIRYFVCSLALSDLLKGVFTIYDSCYSDWIGEMTLAHRIMCTSGYAFFSTLMLADLMTVTLLSLDRLLVLKKPFRYKEMVTSQSVRMSCIITWCVAITCGGLPFYITEMSNITCDYFSIAPYHTLVIISLIWYPVLIVIIIIYIWIYFLARTHIRKVVPLHLYNIPSVRRPSWRRQLKSTLMAFVTLIVVLVGVAPTFMIVSYSALCRTIHCDNYADDNMSLGTSITATMMVFTGVANPLIYGLRVKEVGEQFKSLVSCCKCAKRRPNYIAPIMPGPEAYRLSTIHSWRVEGTPNNY